MMMASALQPAQRGDAAAQLVAMAK